jgi:MFS family permease
VARPTVPSVIADLYRDPRDLRTLVVAAAALAAAGLDPRVYNPGLTSVQNAVRARPELEQLLLVAALVGAGLMLAGGVLGDTDGRRRLMVGALATILVSAIAGLFVVDGPGFVISRFFGLAGASAVLPLALAGVAVTYQGIPRATAIGVAYAAYGGASALAPVMLTLFGPAGPRWPAFVAAAVMASIALVLARRSWPDLPTPSRHQRRRVIATAVWAAGVIVTCVGLLGFGSGSFDPFRLVALIVGVGILAAAAVIERGTPADVTAHVERRAVALALFVGFVIAFAQAAPMLQLPLFFQLISGFGPIAAVVATIPFVVALVVTGPIVGMLLARVSPRPLLTFGVAAVGAGDLVMALLLQPRAPYLGFVVPLVLIGAGFVIATTVRTAIIFASVPRGLPATAAALNEASVALGTRAGLVTSTLAIATLALGAYSASLVGTDPEAAAAATAAFERLLTAIGTPGFGTLVEGMDRSDLTAYAVAYVDAVRITLGVTGIITLGAAVVTWILVGRRDPLTTVWEHRDEREATPAP